MGFVSYNYALQNKIVYDATKIDSEDQYRGTRAKVYLSYFAIYYVFQDNLRVFYLPTEQPTEPNRILADPTICRHF